MSYTCITWFLFELYMYNSNPVLVIHSYTCLYIFIHLVFYFVYMFFLWFLIIKYMWNELIYIHSFVIFWRYVWTCDWKMLGLWFELGLKHLLRRHLSRKHCCIFPASTTTSKLTSPFDVVQVSISLLLLVLLFSRFSCPWFGPWFGRSAVGVRGSILETKSQIRNVLRVPKKLHSSNI